MKGVKSMFAKSRHQKHTSAEHSNEAGTAIPPNPSVRNGGHSSAFFTLLLVCVVGRVNEGVLSSLFLFACGWLCHSSCAHDISVKCDRIVAHFGNLCVHGWGTSPIGGASAREMISQVGQESITPPQNSTADT